MHAIEQEQAYQHDAFISYSGEDRDIAFRFERALKKYKIPDDLKSTNNRLTVFLDEYELQDSGYYRLIENQLQKSHKLLVICSPDARQNDFLNHKIRQFARLHGAGNIIPVLVKGIPNHEAAPGQDLEKALPEALYEVTKQPRFFDFRAVDLERGSPANKNLKRPWYELLSTLLNVDAEALRQSVQRQQRLRRKKTAMGIAAGSIFMVLCLAGFVWLHKINLGNHLSDAKTEIARKYWEKSKIARASNHHMYALHLLSEAISLSAEEPLRRQLLQDFKQCEPFFRLVYILKLGGELGGAVFNRDETRLLTWSNEGVARFRDVSSGQPLGEPFKHSDWIYGAILNSDETRLLTWSVDNTAQLWDAQSARKIAPPLRHGGPVIGALFNGDETRILTWSEDFSARLWDSKTSRPIGAVMQHEGWVNGAVFKKDESLILTWSDDSTAQLWRAESGVKSGPPFLHRGEVNGATFNHDETLILTWSNDSTARLWSAVTGEQIGPSLHHRGDVIGARFNRAETRILTWSRDHTARLWDAATGRALIPPLRHEGWVFGARFNADETRILTWSYDNSARLWDAATGDPVSPPLRHSAGLLGHSAGVFEAIFANNEKYIFTWGDDNAIRIWDAATGELIAAPLQHHDGRTYHHTVKGLIFNKSRNMVFTWSSDSTARLWMAREDLFSRGAADQEVDLDYPPEQFELQVMALTGTELLEEQNTIKSIEPERWQKVHEQYLQFAPRQYESTDYPHANLWRKFFPEEAQRIRPLH